MSDLTHDLKKLKAANLCIDNHNIECRIEFDKNGIKYVLDKFRKTRMKSLSLIEYYRSYFSEVKFEGRDKEFYTDINHVRDLIDDQDVVFQVSGALFCKAWAQQKSSNNDKINGNILFNQLCSFNELYFILLVYISYIESIRKKHVTCIYSYRGYVCRVYRYTIIY